jgi:regulatory protein
VKREGGRKGIAEGKEVEPPAAFERALRLLERRPHFRREVEQKLGRAGCDRAEIVAAVERLAALGYLDDAGNARRHAASLAERKGYGTSRIRAELARRGAPPDAIEEAVGGATKGEGRENELARARAQADRWRRTGRGGADALARHLARRGFAAADVFAIVREQFPDSPVDVD